MGLRAALGTAAKLRQRGYERMRVNLGASTSDTAEDLGAGGAETQCWPHDARSRC